ncbi:hypothetical protein [Halorubellus sp. PRR65]|uniref:hypothetical protein n=1 Tax=Halorubellus sp. PRR65 TaxID=3098148 RepID=UPI002B25B469|nr:hypothetical protein [Halorubellus sp. PRR65]
MKREVILGVLRYHHEWNRDEDRRYHTVVRRDSVTRAAESVLGEIDKDDDYKRDEYIEQVKDELIIRNPGDDQMAFFSASDALEYLESLESGNHKEEGDVYHLTQLLAEQYAGEVDIEVVNAVRGRFNFEPLE